MFVVLMNGFGVAMLGNEIFRLNVLVTMSLKPLERNLPLRIVVQLVFKFLSTISRNHRIT